MYQTMSYEAQMDMKAEQVKNILNEAVNGEYLFEGVKASPKEFAYRNKMEFSFGDEYKDGPLTLGLHKKGSESPSRTIWHRPLSIQLLIRSICMSKRSFRISVLELFTGI